MLYGIQEKIIIILFYIIFLRIYFWVLTTTIKRREKKISKVKKFKISTKKLIIKSCLEYNSKQKSNFQLD